jgi:hypothetical protein
LLQHRGRRKKVLLALTPCLGRVRQSGSEVKKLFLSEIYFWHSTDGVNTFQQNDIREDDIQQNAIQENDIQ